MWGYWSGSGSSPYTAVSQVGDREAAVEWIDDYGDRVCFRLNDANGVDLLVNNDLKVREMTGVRVDGSSLIVDGTGSSSTVVGPGKPATWVVMVPLGQDILVTRVMALFQRRSEVTYRGWRSWIPRPRGYAGGFMNWLGYGLPSYMPASFVGGQYPGAWSGASPRDYRGPPASGCFGGGYNQPTFNYVPGVVAGANPSMAEACCVPEAKGINTGFNYVGETRGSYRQNDQYIYVGEGAGDYHSARKPRDCCWWSSCCVLFSIFVVLALVAANAAGHWRPVISVSWQPVEQEPRFSSAYDGTSIAPTSRTHFSIMNCTDAIYNKEEASRWSEDRKAWCCKSVGVGCKTTSVPYDCLAGYFNWVKGWSEGKKEWCCKHEHRGCPVTTTVHEYDCEGGLDQAETAWSNAQKAWCCHSQRKGCDIKMTTGNPYDCKDHNNWNPGKQAYCCLHHNMNCPPTTTTQPYDCEAGLDNFEAGWSLPKKMWCCSTLGKGCQPTTTQLEFNCEGEEEHWPEEEKTWCCKHRGKGCLEEVEEPTTTRTTTSTNFDCLMDTVESWSIAKREWCCEQDGVGCPHATSVQPYDCEEGHSHWQLWTEEKKEWCCEYHKTGCAEAEKPPVKEVHAEAEPEAKGEELTCDLNCFGAGADAVVLKGSIGVGEGAFISAVTQEQCIEVCRRTPDCEAVTFTEEGGGKCYGKKNVHTSECQLGGKAWKMQMLTDVQPWGKCAVFGDPHIVTFDRILGPHTRQFHQGDYWLVHSPRLTVQGRFGFTHRFPNASSTLGFAVGGPLIQGHRLVVEYIGREETSPGRRRLHEHEKDGFKVTWDGEEILQDYPANWESADKVLVATHKAMNPSKYHREGRHTIGGTDEDHSLLPSFLFEFPEADLSIYALEGPDNCNVVISMRRLHGGQDGYCGNFNCDVGDDSTEALKERGLADPIPQGQSLFEPMPEWRLKQGRMQERLGGPVADPESEGRGLESGVLLQPSNGSAKASEREDAAALFLKPLSREPVSKGEAERMMEEGAAKDLVNPADAQPAEASSLNIYG